MEGVSIVSGFLYQAASILKASGQRCLRLPASLNHDRPSLITFRGVNKERTEKKSPFIDAIMLVTTER